MTLIVPVAWYRIFLSIAYLHSTAGAGSPVMAASSLSVAPADMVTSRRWRRSILGARKRGLAMKFLLASDGLLWPALLMAITRNWYSLPSIKLLGNAQVNYHIQQ